MAPVHAGIGLIDNGKVVIPLDPLLHHHAKAFATISIPQQFTNRGGSLLGRCDVSDDAARPERGMLVAPP